ncbi:hypothetical protein T484DRAFT_1832492 [Baffinella frigidus]|nr:hypothetical protein T484DRAFT_1832492 [Cryptophyta sp. CCMP2293]
MASSFEGFVGRPAGHRTEDQWTTLKDVKDRVFSTAVETPWTSASDNSPYNDCYNNVKKAFLDKFAGCNTNDCCNNNVKKAFLDKFAVHLNDVY